MPELPEVEAIKNQLGKFLKGHRIVDVEIRNPKYEIQKENIIGAKITGTRRFGKVAVIDLSNGYSLIAHVKLTGQFIYRGPNLKNPQILSKKVVGGVPGPHTLVIFNLNKDGVLYYNDVRRFGWIRVVKTLEVPEEPFIKKLGPEPFRDLTLEKFSEILFKTKRQIKVVLMDQTKMGGVGNIYANDALYLARINPKRKAKELTGKEGEGLYEAVKKVINLGIKYGGASVDKYVDAAGWGGKYQEHFLVYGRNGQKCTRDGNVIKKIKLGGRGTYFCPGCQQG